MYQQSFKLKCKNPLSPSIPPLQYANLSNTRYNEGEAFAQYQFRKLKIFLYKFSKLNFVMREHKEPYLFPSGLKAKAFIGPKCPFTPPISS